jgi:hypothetical protein
MGKHLHGASGSSLDGRYVNRLGMSDPDLAVENDRLDSPPSSQ